MGKIGACVAACAMVLALLMSAPVLATGSTKTVSITASEFKFAPAAITLRRGQRAALVITNKGAVDHEFLSTIFKAAKDVMVRAAGANIEADEVEEVEIEKGHAVTTAANCTGTWA